MKISIDAALKNGWNRMTNILFKPFDFLKWLILGFASFLASLGQGRGLNLNFPSGDNFGKQASGDIQNFKFMLMENIVPIVMVGLGVFFVVLAISLLILWLSSCGKFIFLYSILNNKAEIKAPWAKYGHLGDMLFLFRLLFGLCLFFIILIVLGAGVVMMLPYFKSEVFGGGFWLTLIPMIFLFILLVICVAVINAVLTDFVVPIMFKNDESVIPGFKVFYHELLKGHLWNFVIFYLVKFALGIATGVVVMIGACCTCCVAAIPYVSSVVFLPVAAFLESYTLSFLAQFGGDWDLFTWELDTDVPPAPLAKEEALPSPTAQEEPNRPLEPPDDRPEME